MLMLMYSGPAAAGTLHRFGRPLGGASRTATCARRVLATTGIAAVAGLVAFHLYLFWQQLADGSLLDASLALRWVLGGLLTAGLVAFKRAGVPLLWGRRALVLWLLVAFLHWGHASPVAPADGPARAASAATYEIPSTFASLIAGLCLLALCFARRAHVAAPREARAWSCAAAPPGRPQSLPRVRPPRAPPVFA